MTEEILTAAGIPAQAARFPDADQVDVFAITFDSVTAGGSDDDIDIRTHDDTVELYASTISAGDAAKRRLEAELKARGLHYATQGWYWLQEIRRYQEIYEFTYYEKI